MKTNFIYNRYNDEFYIQRCDNDDIRPEVKEEFYLFLEDEDKVKMANFMGLGDRLLHKNDGWANSKIVVPLDVSVCFSNNQKIIFFKNNLKYKPERASKFYKTATKFVKKWFDEYPLSHDLPRDIHYWKFKKESDYVMVNYSFRCLVNLIPELFVDDSKWNDFDIRVRVENDKFWNDLFFKFEPYNLDSSFDYTEEIKEAKRKAEILRWEVEQKALEELEELKHTPGHCSRCGASNASYCRNPFYSEMYDATVMEWLCPDCYNDCLGDI